MLWAERSPDGQAMLFRWAQTFLRTHEPVGRFLNDTLRGGPRNYSMIVRHWQKP